MTTVLLTIATVLARAAAACIRLATDRMPAHRRRAATCAAIGVESYADQAAKLGAAEVGKAMA